MVRTNRIAGRINRSAKPTKVHTVDLAMTAVELAELISVLTFRAPGHEAEISGNGPIKAHDRISEVIASRQ